jgi:hypothetical protein
MNVRWMRSNAVLLAFLVVVMVAVGVLAVLVVRQQQAQDTDNGRIHLQTAPAAGASSRVNTPDPANALTKPDAPSQVGTGETAPVEVPVKDQTSGSSGRPVKSDEPSRKVSGETAPAAGVSSRANTPDPANLLTKPDAPSHVGTGETAPVEAPAKDQTADSDDRPVKSGKPSREVSRETAPMKAPAKDQTSDSRHRDPDRAAG